MLPFKRYDTLSDFEFHHTLSQTQGIALVFFSSPGCASCRHWRVLLDRFLKRRLDVRVFEVDAATEQAVTREFDVFHLPALFVFRDGQYRGPLSCEARLEPLEAAVAQVAALPPQEMP